MVYLVFIDNFIYTNYSFNLTQIRKIKILTNLIVRQLMINFLGYLLTNYQTIENIYEKYEYLINSHTA